MTGDILGNQHKTDLERTGARDTPCRAVFCRGPQRSPSYPRVLKKTQAEPLGQRNLKWDAQGRRRTSLWVGVRQGWIMSDLQ